MNAEIIAVGTELLLGQIVNTNAAFVAKELASLGVNAYYQTVVGDNEEKLKEAFRIAEGRSDFLILIGGLGPTQDDITKETLAAYLAEPLVSDPGALEHIRHWFAASGREMTENNRKQAQYFQNGRVFPNRNGHAVGTFLEKAGKAYLLLPGPPKELEKMFREKVRPFLEEYIRGEKQYILSKTLRFFGMGESTLTDRLQDIISAQTNPTIAPYAGNYEVTLRITANGVDEAECRALLEETAGKILAVVGDYCYGEGESNSLMAVVKNLLQERGLRLSAAESLTGGLFQAELVKVPEIGDIFPGGIVSYEEAIKQDVLGVPQNILQEHGMVSEQCAIAMAECCRGMFQSDIGISFTGAAGPDELEGHPAGTVWIGVSQKGKTAFARKYRFLRDRNGNREQTVMQGFELLRRTLLAEEASPK